MRFVSCAILFVASIILGLLYWQSRDEPVTAVDNVTAEVRLDGLAMRQPEVLLQSQVSLPAAPVTDEPAREERVDLGGPGFTETAVLPLTEDNLSGVRCVVTSSMSEKTLPNLRKTLEALALVGRMRIEAVPVAQRYAAYLGPFDRKRAIKELQRLMDAGFSGVSVAELKRDGYAVVVRTFEQGKDAELWSREFAHTQGLSNVRLTRLSEAVESRIRLAFPGIAPDEAFRLQKAVNKEGLMLYVCPAQ